MTDKELDNKQSLKKTHKIEHTPVKFWREEGEKDLKFTMASNGDCISKPLKEIVGVKDFELATSIIDTGAHSISLHDRS